MARPDLHWQSEAKVNRPGDLQHEVGHRSICGSPALLED